MNPYIEMPRFARRFQAGETPFRRIERDLLDLALSSAAYRWAVRVEAAVQSLPALLRRVRRRRAAINELSALPDRLLRDIGVDRSAIPRVVDGLLEHEESDARR